MTAVESAIAEINDRLTVFAPQHEGLRDFALLNLGDAAKREVLAEIVLYDRRVSLLIAAKSALSDLMADGHPDLPVREISPDAMADLQNNVSTIEAAAAKFAAIVASNLSLVGGTVAPK